LKWNYLYDKKGEDVVKKIESLGSNSGKPAATITVKDSGEL